MSVYVCTHEDAYIHDQSDHGEAQWRARLSNGQVVIQDDGRPGIAPQSAWKRLAAYVKAESLFIDKLWLQFRDNRVDELVENADGYFFCKAGLGCTFSPTEHYYLVGHLQNQKLMVQTWSVPALIFTKSEERDPLKAGDCLICNERQSLWLGYTSD